MSGVGRQDKHVGILGSTRKSEFEGERREERERWGRGATESPSSEEQLEESVSCKERVRKELRKYESGGGESQCVLRLSDLCARSTNRVRGSIIIPYRYENNAHRLFRKLDGTEFCPGGRKVTGGC